MPKQLPATLRQWVDQGSKLEQLPLVDTQRAEFLRGLESIGDERQQVAAEVLGQIHHRLPLNSAETTPFEKAMDCLHALGVPSPIAAPVTYVKDYIERNGIRSYPSDQRLGDDTEVNDLISCLFSMRNRAACDCVVALARQFGLWDRPGWYYDEYCMRELARYGGDAYVLEKLRSDDPAWWLICAKAFGFGESGFELTHRDKIRVAIARGHWGVVRDFGNEATDLLLHFLPHAGSYPFSGEGLETPVSLIAEFGDDAQKRSVLEVINRRILSWSAYHDLAERLGHRKEDYDHLDSIVNIRDHLLESDDDNKDFINDSLWPWLDHYRTTKRAEITSLFSPLTSHENPWVRLAAAAVLRTVGELSSFDADGLVLTFFDHYRGETICFNDETNEPISATMPQWFDESCKRVDIAPDLIEASIESATVHQVTRLGGTDDASQGIQEDRGVGQIRRLARRHEACIDDLLERLSHLPDATGQVYLPNEPITEVPVSMEARRATARRELERRRRSIPRRLRKLLLGRFFNHSDGAKR